MRVVLIRLLCLTVRAACRDRFDESRASTACFGPVRCKAQTGALFPHEAMTVPRDGRAATDRKPTTPRICVRRCVAVRRTRARCAARAPPHEATARLRGCLGRAHRARDCGRGINLQHRQRHRAQAAAAREHGRPRSRRRVWRAGWRDATVDHERAVPRLARCPPRRSKGLRRGTTCPSRSTVRSVSNWCAARKSPRTSFRSWACRQHQSHRPSTASEDRPAESVSPGARPTGRILARSTRAVPRAGQRRGDRREATDARSP